MQPLCGSGDVQAAHGVRSGCSARVGVRLMHPPPQVRGLSVPGRGLTASPGRAPPETDVRRECGLAAAHRGAGPSEATGQPGGALLCVAGRRQPRLRVGVWTVECAVNGCPASTPGTTGRRKDTPRSWCQNPRQANVLIPPGAKAQRPGSRPAPPRDATVARDGRDTARPCTRLGRFARSTTRPCEPCSLGCLTRTKRWAGCGPTVTTGRTPTARHASRPVCDTRGT